MTGSPEIHRLVAMGDFVASHDPEAVVTTCAIGSCLAIAVHDAHAGVGGILHFILPNSRLNETMAQIQPHMFCDTGWKAFWKELQGLGVQPASAVVKLVGGSVVLDDLSYHEIGRDNIQTARRLLEETGLTVLSEDTGGRGIRTVRLEIASGLLTVRHQNDTHCI